MLGMLALFVAAAVVGGLLGAWQIDRARARGRSATHRAARTPPLRRRTAPASRASAVVPPPARRRIAWGGRSRPPPHAIRPAWDRDHSRTRPVARCDSLRRVSSSRQVRRGGAAFYATHGMPSATKGRIVWSPSEVV